MPGIWNVNTNYNINSRKILSKLSFDLGESFLARVVDSSEDGKELLLKLLDGWQFAAKLEKPIEFAAKELIKFQVVDFQDGQLIIKALLSKDEEKEKDTSSLDSALEDQKLNVEKKDYQLLKSMIKHNIPLTKENISVIKSMIDFKEKLVKDENQGESFIQKYLSGKSIEAQSSEAKNIKETLRGFFKELSSLSSEELLTLEENGVEFTEHNIKSFNRLFKEEASVHKALGNILKNLRSSIEQEVRANNGAFSVDATNNKMDIYGKGHIEYNNEEIDSLLELFKSANQGIGEGKSGESTLGRLAQSIGNSLEEGFSDNGTEIKPEDKQNWNASNNNWRSSVELVERASKQSSALEEYLEKKDKINEDDAVESPKILDSGMKKANSGDGELDTKSSSKLNHLPKDASHLSKLQGEDTATLVKAEFRDKGLEAKILIKNILEEKLSLKPEVYNKIMEGFKETINDFKVFNTISNQYYYMDVPLNVRNQEYPCKLIIKDDRKSGKKIDSRDVKLAVTVKTGAMGVVDSYIKASYFNLHIDIKCEEKWIKLLELGKDKIAKDLESLSYNITVSVGKREKEVTLVDCREFFEDSSLGSINTRV